MVYTVTVPDQANRRPEVWFIEEPTAAELATFYEHRGHLVVKGETPEALYLAAKAEGAPVGQYDSLRAMLNILRTPLVYRGV